MGNGGDIRVLFEQLVVTGITQPALADDDIAIKVHYQRFQLLAFVERATVIDDDQLFLARHTLYKADCAIGGNGAGIAEYIERQLRFFQHALYKVIQLCFYFNCGNAHGFALYRGI